MVYCRRAGLAGLLAFIVGVALSAAPARATWSIVLIDTRTGEIAVGSATCLTTFDLQKWTPVLITGVGAATAQASVGGTQFANRTFIRDRMLQGAQPGSIIVGLASYDSLHASRQYGMVDVLGRRATFTGPQASQWAGGMTGSFDYTDEGQTGTIVYAIQGNILTGSPVVQLAVAAARDTPGDLPQRLMAAMEAARAAGGDGRCSCPMAPPTSCGAPPPSFEKSAHIGYMLIARAGDTDASHSYYRAGIAPGALVATDLSGDGLPDVATVDTSAFSASVLRNVTTPAGIFPQMSLQTAYALGATARGVAAGDVTGDGTPDLIVSEPSLGRISVRPGAGDGTFGAAVPTAVGGRPGELLLADLDTADGPDLALIDEMTATVMVLLNDGEGGFLAPASYPGAPGQQSLIAADVNGDHLLDLVVASPTQAELAVLLGSGAGAFAPAPGIPAAGVAALAAGDFNDDGTPDLAGIRAATPGPSALTILLNTAGGFTGPTLELPVEPNGVAAGDVSNDGTPDLVIAADGGRFLTVHGSASGQFALAGDFDLATDFAAGGVGRVALADMDADGDLDAVFSISTFGSIAVAENTGDGAFVGSAGTAAGDYFLAFNVPNQPAGAPDPVVQLQSMFDAWRAGLIGRPDAARSLVEVPTLIAGSTNTGVMTVTLRDWAGDPIAVPISSLTVEPVPGDQPHVTAGAITNPSPGVYEVTMSASTAVGSTRFVITADDGVRPVVLMPVAEVAAAPCPADWNADGLVNSNDIASYLQAWLASLQGGTLGADFDNDGTVSSADISAFLARWIAGVTGVC